MSMPKFRKIWYVSGAAVVLIIIAELAGRALGLGKPLLFEASDEYGYRIKPNQNINRFGKHVFINEEGLRSRPFKSRPEKGLIRILCLGDSLTNGGERIDQARTYPYILEEALKREGVKSEVLNASASGWSLENEAAYIKKHGIYKSSIVVLLMSSQDLIERPAVKEAVNRCGGFPSKSDNFALAEIVREIYGKYYCKGSHNNEMALNEEAARSILIEKAARRGIKLNAIGKSVSDAETEYLIKNGAQSLRDVADLVERDGAKLFIMFLELPRKKLDPGLFEYCMQQISKTLKGSKAVFIDITENVKKAGWDNLFYDGIHPNISGNSVIADEAARVIMAGR